MKFRKIDDLKFQVYLNKDDMKNFNVSIDDFLQNDAEKIHALLDIVMEEAYEQIGVDMDGVVMSLQLVPQPNHSMLLTVSGKKDGEKKNPSELKFKRRTAIKDSSSVAYDKAALTENMKKLIMFSFDSLQDVEEFCAGIKSAWGIKSSLYKDEDGYYYLVVQNSRISDEKYSKFLSKLLEYASLEIVGDLSVSYVTEHLDVLIANNAIGNMKKYCG